MKMKEEKSQIGWRDFLSLVRGTNPSKGRMAFAVGFSVLSTIVGLVIPLLTKGFIDDFTMESFKWIYVVGLFVIFLVQAVASGLSIYLLNYVGQHIVASLRTRVWDKHIKLPVSFYDQTKTGEMISRIINDTSIVKNLITEHVTNFFTGLISIIGSIIILLYLDWKMTMVMLIAVPLAIGIILPLGRKMYKISRSLQDETATFTSTISQTLSEIRLVKASNAEEREFNKGKTGITHLFEYGVKEARIQAIIGPLMTLVMMAMLVIVLGYGGFRVSSGALTAGDLVAFILYLFQIVVPLSRFTNFFTQLQKAVGATERIVAILSRKEEPLQSGKRLGEEMHSIVLDHVQFSYNQDEPVLKDVSFTVKPNAVTAVVGPSGSGKTTLFSLLERFYAPTGGAIIVNDLSIESFSLEEWRSKIGYVSQESPIIAGTIRDNIVYGLDEIPPEEEIHQAARMAYADEFIQAFPSGYETEVGERGIKLSGGQRQRIGIARALIRNPQILLLDEATSSLDSKAEMVVQKALDNLMKDRTTIVIAHRLSTVVNADQIVFLDQGNVTGVGDHTELYDTHQTYKQFADEQLKMKQN
ncbi:MULTISPECIES: ABC transporter ATP-binding protein [Pontibacillus]|uniref:ABC transporter ATP-binding protein n=1 Tax=Pontibacillus chungwhensis TaxID=265426 RepID=A0ABY8V2M1_9BACI|nr:MULTISPECIES: ABC transporter ATP-binding protein [Pontibacillus]MCD5323254.1 ABC transporter ATP-binding protein/permease [Pontibacillus sp. HN14]WIG00203.1 ABC transporter ATP-binding protein [Pontibacillus chungwhensis]